MKSSFSAWLPAAALTVVFFAAGAWAAQPGQWTDPWTDYPETIVERPLLPVPGGIRLQGVFSSEATKNWYNDNGKPEETEVTYNLFVWDVSFEYGMSEFASVQIGIPYLAGEIDEASGANWGDLYAALWFSIPIGEDFEISPGIWASVPTGNNDYNYELIEGEFRQQNFITGAPGPVYRPGVRTRVSRERAMFVFSFFYVSSQEEDVEYLRTGSTEREADIDPGDGVEASVSFYYQAADKFVPSVTLSYLELSETEVNGEPQGDFEKQYRFTPGLWYQIAPATDLFLGISIPAGGVNTPATTPVIFNVTSRF